MTDIHQFEPLWGAWRIEKELGEGGYGKVYKAVRKEFGATYYAAIKHISIPMNQTEVKNLYEEGLVEDEASARGYYERMLENILYEIRMMNALKGHTNIVAYEDHLVIEKRDMPGYDVFIRMELLRGLYEHMSSTEFTVLDVCKLGIDICTALEVLESKNIVHRDVKPANILYSDDGNYKLSDFGVARTLNNNATVMSKKGTYSYMAPEVYRGQPASFNSDIYSLGLVMYRLLNNNRAPFLPLDGSAVTYEQNEEALMRRMNGETIPYALNADQGMASLLSIACDFKPEYRFQTAAQFKAALLSYKEDIAPNRNTIIFKENKGLEQQEKKPEAVVKPKHKKTDEAVKPQEPANKVEESKSKSKKAPAIMAVAAAAVIAVASVIELSFGNDNLPAASAITTPDAVATSGLDADVLTAAPIIATPDAEMLSVTPAIVTPTSGSAGYVVGLRTDGTVIAAGKNNYGQCDVNRWKDIIEVAAGEYHTVGLKADGTVIAVGKNNYDQCNVNEWNNIVKIAADEIHTIGLKADGTVVVVGRRNNAGGYDANNWHNYDVNNWHNIVEITASANHIVGLKSNGTVVAASRWNYDQCDVDDWTDIVAISTDATHTFGLKADGTVVAAGKNDYGQCNVNEWNNIAKIAASGSHTVGLKSDGTVVAVGWNYYGQCNVDDWTDIVAISADLTHTFGLKADGTVVVAGKRDIDVSNWNLNAAAAPIAAPATEQPEPSAAATPVPTSTPVPTTTPVPTATPMPTDTPKPSDGSGSTGNISVKELRIEQSRDLMNYINKYRSNAGVSALSWNSSLGSDAESTARAWSNGGDVIILGTTIARQCNGAKTASKAVSDWMEGNDYVPSYSSTLLGSQYTQIGAAMCYLPEGNEYGYHYFWCIILS